MSLTHNPNAPEDRTVRSNRRSWWIIAACVALLLGVIGWLYLYYDSSPPDPALYQIALKPVPDGENALAVFERETAAARRAMEDDWRDRLANDEDGLDEFNPSTEPALREHVEANQEFLQAFWKFVREAPRPLPVPGIDDKMDLKLTSISLSALNALVAAANLARRAIWLDILNGKRGEALAAGLELADLAKELSSADGLAIHSVVIVGLHVQTLTCVGAALPGAPLDLPTIRDVQRRLALTEFSPDDLARVHRLELWAQVNYWRHLKDAGGSAIPSGAMPDSGWLVERLIKPNMTSFECIDLLGPLAEGSDKGWGDGLRVGEALLQEGEKISPSSSLRVLVHPNFMGRYLVATSGASMHHITQRTVQGVVRSRCLETALALREFELQTGALPETLAELVPEYLAAVPMDPVTDLPLHWKRDTGRLYSVGADEVDDGGDFKPGKSMTQQRDWGIVYPWRAVEEM